MKLFFVSDIHGDLAACKKALEMFEKEGASRLVLLGDILYHGPRNDLPVQYDPKGVTLLLSAYADRILAVRGNCDTEVDQMVLPFPVLAEYAVLLLAENRVAYLWHGHKRGTVILPLAPTDILIEGHTHVAGVTTDGEGRACLNPGSVSMPKGDTPPAYMVYGDGVFSIRRLADGGEIAAYKV